MLKKYYSLALLSLFLFFAITSNPSWAADYNKVGVKVGDTADYAIQEDNPEVTRLHLYVDGISETTITLELTYYFENGTQESTEQLTGDIGIGSGVLYLFLITPNLVEGDAIYSGAPATIDKTFMMSTAGVSRLVNHYSVGDPTLDCYWDQSTGLIVKRTFWLFGWMNLTMTAISLWPDGLALPLSLLSGIIGVFIFGVIAGYFTGKKKR